VHEAYSISAGLDYPGVGPEHAMLRDSGRVRYETITDKEALEAFQLLCRTEGIIPALESSHALAQVIKEAQNAECRMQDESKQLHTPHSTLHTSPYNLLVCLSGRGDKDLQHVAGFIR